MAAAAAASVSSAADVEAKEKESCEERPWYLQLVDKKDELLRHVAMGLISVMVALVGTGNYSLVWEWILLPSWNFLLRIVGTMMGVGLGLGLASHVHDRLEVWHARQDQVEEESSVRTTSKSIKISNTNSAWEEETTYASLMASAGYDVSDRVHRAQVMRRSSNFLKPFYPFTNVASEQQHGPKIMAQQWPHLPKCVSFQLGCFIEHIVRDYVASWYSIIDGGCPYENEREKRARIKAEEEEAKQGNSHESAEELPTEISTLSDRVMVWSTAGHRPMPLLHTMYHSLAIIFGNLSSRVEHVNVFSLVLLKWFKVLGHSFKVYRQMRRLALQKAAAQSPKHKKKHQKKKTLQRANSAPVGNASSPIRGVRDRRLTASAVGINAELLQSTPQTDGEESDVTHSMPAVRLEFVEEGVPVTDEGDARVEQKAREDRAYVSEMAVAKEYLLAGKLHRAVTFGLDVPSLLFADTSGKACGVGSEGTDPLKEELTEEQVLEKRLFETNIVSECELDYHRVLANRFCRALLPRSEFSSPIIRTLFTEMMAGCVLSPIMGCFAPDYINDWICQVVDSMSSATEEDKQDEDNEDGNVDDVDDMPRGDERDTSMEKDEEMPTNDDVASKDEAKVENAQNVAAECDDHATDDDEGFGSNLSDFGDDTGMEDDFDDEIGAADVSLGSIAPMEDDEKDALDPSNHGVEEQVSSPEKPGRSSGDDILPLVSLALIDLRQYVDFEDCREARLRKEEVMIDWDDPKCRESVRQLVLVIEGALLHGCRASRKRTKSKKFQTEQAQVDLDDENEIESFENEIDERQDAVEVSLLPEHQSSSLSLVLMELTSDIEAFEDRVMEEEKEQSEAEEDSVNSADGLGNGFITHKPSQTEISTLRTLIAAWLHTGQIYRIVSVICRAHKSVLEPFYHRNAFLRNPQNAKDFVQQLKSLNGVDILVDTMAVLASSSLDFDKNGSRILELKNRQRHEMLKREVGSALATPTSIGTSSSTNGRLSLSAQRGSLTQKAGLAAGSVKRLVTGGTFDSAVSPNASGTPTSDISGAGSATAAALSQRYFGSSTPRYLDFNRNEAFASSLRLERERRRKSWADVTAVKEGELPEIVCRSKGVTNRDKVIHRELHNISRVLYAATNVLAIRNGARRKQSEDSDGISMDSSIQSEPAHVALLTVETASQRRRIEVPDDDSSFLLRAQARPLNPVGVHRDQRNSDQSFKSFYATYEEAAVLPGDTRYRGGRYIRRCLLRYFPIDRTASIAIPQDYRKLDHRSGKLTDDLESTVDASSTSFLSSDFLRERHLCKKWYQRGAAPRSGSILTSSVMEPTDFCAVPRTGRALDFVYRMALFERPMVDLGGKRFTVHDSTSAGVHRADASALEMSDAALSAALLTIGNDWTENDVGGNERTEKDTESQNPNDAQLHLNEGNRPKVEMGPDGYPIVWLKFNTKQGDKNNVEVKPCRTSYIRASLLIASTRQDAQLQCLVRCVRAGSARSATKARTEALLWPTLKLLEFANGPMRDKQSVLLRDLKLGINHIDREQLRRNGVLSPRSPTSIVSLMTVVEGALQAKDTGVDMHGASPTSIVFKIRCVAVVEAADFVEDDDAETQYLSEDGSNTGLFREEWVVFRSFREFSQLHRQLKSQVAVTETSMSAGSRLVGAAAAAFTVHGGSAGSNRMRKAMIPSLGQAKAGALGATRKTIQKRRAVLGGYLKHLTSTAHLLNRCPELLMFLGAFYPFPPEVRTEGGIVNQFRDSLGRTQMSRTMLQPVSAKRPSVDSDPGVSKSVSLEEGTPAKEGDVRIMNRSSIAEKTDGNSVATGGLSTSQHGKSSSPDKPGSKHDGLKQKRRSRKIVMKPSIKAKIDQVTLAEVRFSIFELVRYLFDFDNASFFRSRVFSALKTMSFAVTTGSEFKKMLYETHVKQFNPEAIAGWVRFGLDMLWPDGVFMESKPALTPEESKALAENSKEKLPAAFPDQIRTVLGGDITQNGIEILHEMLQNRLVLKSMAYMLFDLLWLEIFPELQDILTCGSALDME